MECYNVKKAKGLVMNRTKKVSVMFELEKDKVLLNRIGSLVGADKQYSTQTKAIRSILKDFFVLTDKLKQDNLAKMQGVKLLLEWKGDGFQVIDTEVVKDKNEP